MGLEKLDTRLGFFISREEDVTLPVLVKVKKPIGSEAADMLTQLGVSRTDIESRKFVFALSLATETIKLLAEKSWVVKIMFRREN